MRTHSLKLWNYLYSSQAVRQSALMTVGSIVTAGLSAVALIYLSRLMGPIEFGALSVGISLSMIIAKLGDLGLGAVITRYVPSYHQDKKTIRTLLAQVFQWRLLLIGGWALILPWLIPLSEQLLNFPRPEIVALSLLGSLILVFYEHVLVVISAIHKFSWASFLGMFQAGLKAAAFVGLGLLGLTSTSVITTAYFLAPLVSAVFVAQVFPEFFFVWPKSASAVLKQSLRSYAFHAGIGVLAVTAISNIDVLFVQKYLTTFDTGIYAAAARIALVVGLMTAAIGGVLNNRVARYKTRKDLSAYLRKSLLVVLMAGIGFATFLPVARFLLIMSVGPEYLPGLNALIILVLNAFLALAIVPYTAFFYAVDHPWYFSFGGILQAVIIIVGNVLFLSVYGVEAAAWTRVIATCAHVLFTIFALAYVWQTEPLK